MTMPPFEKRFTCCVTLCGEPFFGIVHPLNMMTRRRWIAIKVANESRPDTFNELDASGRLVVRPPREPRRVGLFDRVRTAVEDAQHPAPPAANEAIAPWSDAFQDCEDLGEDYPVF
jgi:hypothetical protein